MVAIEAAILPLFCGFIYLLHADCLLYMPVVLSPGFATSSRGGGLIWEIGIGSDWNLGCCFRADQQFPSCWCGYCATCRFHAYSGEEMVPAGTPQVDWPCCFRSAWCRRLQGEWGQECLLVHAGWYW